MDLIIHQVVELQVIHIAHGNAVLERFTAAPIVQDGLTILITPRLFEQGLDVLFRSAIEYGGSDMPAQGFCRHAKVQFKHLADVHAGRHAQRVKHDLKGRSIGQERHILLRQDAGNNALVAMAARHLIAHGDLALLRDVYAHQLIHAWRQLVFIFAREYLHVHDHAAFAMRHAQGRIAHLAGLFAEDGAQQALLRSKLRLALWRDFTYQNIARAHFCADANDAALIEVSKRIFAYIGDIARDLFLAELGIPRLGFMFFNVDRGINVLFHQLLAD